MRNYFLPACIRLMNMSNPLCIVCFPEKHTNMIPLEDKLVLVHPRRVSRATAPFSSLLPQRGWERVAAGTLRAGCTWCWGGREGKKEKKLKRTSSFFFPTCDKSCSHMGGTRPSYLTKGWLWWSQWSIQSGGVTLYSRQQEESLSQWDCEEISSTALYNSFLGVSFLIPVSLNICSALILQAQWSANSNKQ